VNYDKKTIETFLALLKEGLWEDKTVRASYLMGHDCFDVDWGEVYQLASEQSVLGLVLAGIDCLPSDLRPPKIMLLQWIGEIQMLERQNKEMNAFIGELVNKMWEAGIYTLLVKGQGIAQCYDRPLWRACGDVDLLLDAENYEKAKVYLTPLALVVDEEDKGRLHLGLTIDQWLVELHGTLHTNHHIQMDGLLDEVQREIFQFGKTRVWKNDTVDVLLPAQDEDVVFVFAHILQHFFKGGIGLRQICDWCRLLWIYRTEIDKVLLETRLNKMGMMPKWKAFAAFAVYYLEMPVDAMPLFSDEIKWKKKAGRILTLIMESGNFGHGRDRSYKENHSAFVSNIISFGVYTKYNMMQFSIFPWDAVKGWYATIVNGVKARISGKKNCE